MAFETSIAQNMVQGTPGAPKTFSCSPQIQTTFKNNTEMSLDFFIIILSWICSRIFQRLNDERYHNKRNAEADRRI